MSFDYSGQASTTAAAASSTQNKRKNVNSGSHARNETRNEKMKDMISMIMSSTKTKNTMKGGGVTSGREIKVKSPSKNNSS